MKKFRNTLAKMTETWKIFFKNIGKALKKLSPFFENFTDIFESENFYQIFQRIRQMLFRCMDHILSKRTKMNINVALGVALHLPGPTLRKFSERFEKMSAKLQMEI